MSGAQAARSGGGMLRLDELHPGGSRSRGGFPLALGPGPRHARRLGSAFMPEQGVGGCLGSMLGHSDHSGRQPAAQDFGGRGTHGRRGLAQADQPDAGRGFQRDSVRAGMQRRPRQPQMPLHRLCRIGGTQGGAADGP